MMNGLYRGKFFCVILLFVNSFFFISLKSNDSRSICPECPVTTPAAYFCNVEILDNLCVDNNALIKGDLNVCGVINTGGLTACPAFGNTVRVDKVFGNDQTGERNGCPFLTIGAALSVAQPGDVVWIFPGVYEESIVIPDGVAVKGLCANRVTIQRTNVTTDTDLVVMGENARLEEVLLKLTSSAHVNLRGIIYPGTTSTNAIFRYSSLLIDNSGAGEGSSDVIGIQSSGIGRPNRVVSVVRSANIIVSSTGEGKKRGILVNGPNGFFVRDTNIIAQGGSDSIGVETNDRFAELRINTSTVGGDSADISQTLGLLSVSTTDLVHATANSLGFDTDIQPSTLVWADPGSLPAGISYMRPGTATVSPYEITFRASQKLLVKSLNVTAHLPPGGSVTDTWIVRRNEVSTPLVVTLTGNQTTNINSDISVHFDKDDNISLQLVRGNNSGTTDVVAIMEIY